VYYGSTIQTLMERWWLHKSNFNTWKKGGKICACFKLFDEYGIDNFRIELVEDYPCDNDEQLRMKEQEYLDANECVNEQRAYISPEDTRIQMRKYYLEHQAEKVVCECGRELSKGGLPRHRKTAYHLSRI